MSTNANLIEALSSEELDAIDEEISHLPDRASAAIEALRIVQAHRGWVSDGSLRAIARHLEMSPAELDSIATFYNLIFRKPVGRHVIMVCNSISCFIMGCERVRARLCQELGVQPGETTTDGRFTILPIVCLGACDKAPTLTIDEELFGNVDPADLSGLLERFE